MPLDYPLPKILERFRAQFDACDEVLTFAQSKFVPWTGRGVESGTIDAIVAGEGAKATKTYRAGLMLASGAFGQQAFMLARAVFEAALVAHWVVAYPDEAVELFNQHERHTRLLWGDTLRSLDWYDGPPPPEASEKERAELAGLFGEWGHKHWTRRSLHQLRTEVQHMWDDGGKQLGDMHKVALRESNLILHSSAWSLGYTDTQVEGTDASFEAGPSMQFVFKALHFLLWSYGQIVGLVMDHFEMPDRQGFTDTFQRAHDSFGPSE